MAIDDLLDEHEQGERVRNWLKNNAVGLIGGIALGLALILGWKWYGQHREQRAQVGYSNYIEALKVIDGADLKNVQAKVDVLRDGGDQLYADLVLMQLAQAQVNAGQNEAALESLKSVNKSSTLKPYADLHAARLSNAAGKYDEAITLLNPYNSTAALEVMGDAFVLTGKQEQARDTYLKALTLMDIASPQRRLVEIKLTHAGGTLPSSVESIQ